MTILRVLTLFALAACADAVTSVELTVHSDPAWQLDQYQVRIDAKTASTAIYTELHVLVPDEMAGSATTIEVRGMRGNEQLAFGSTSVVPELHASVRGDVVLQQLGCSDVCELGAIACAGEGTMTCERTAEGCNGWGAITACPSDAPYCSNGVCSATCSDECAPGATKCEGSGGLRSCGQFDADTCLDWSTPNPCGDNQTCIGDTCTGTCDPATCTMPPAPTCVGAKIRRTFQGTGTCGAGDACEYAYTDLKCPDGCLNGRCISVTAGNLFSCSLTSTGSIQCWGYNDKGQLNAPSGTFTQVRSGWDDACALRSDGTIACWGESWTAPTGTFVYLAASRDQACAIRPTGASICWGSNFQTPPNDAFVSIDAGHYHNCGVTTAASVVCWGSDASAQVSYTPTTGTWLAAGAGQSHSCAIKSTGQIYCWGSNSIGESQPPAGTFTSMEVGYDRACAIKSDKTVECWGNDTFGETAAQSGTFLAVASGEGHTCAVRANGSIACWGWNAYGQSSPP